MEVESRTRITSRSIGSRDGALDAELENINGDVEVAVVEEVIGFGPPRVPVAVGVARVLFDGFEQGETPVGPVEGAVGFVEVGVDVGVGYGVPFGVPGWVEED